jgi:hypothetical protein
MRVSFMRSGRVAEIAGDHRGGAADLAHRTFGELLAVVIDSPD